MVTQEENYQQFLQDIAEQNTVCQAMPQNLIIGLTDACNLHCAFCPFCGFCMKKIQKIEQIPFSVLEKCSSLFDSLTVFNPSARGEPFLYPEFDQFIDCAGRRMVCGV